MRPFFGDKGLEISSATGRPAEFCNIFIFSRTPIRNNLLRS
jgi:hypothetical protein